MHLAAATQVYLPPRGHLALRVRAVVRAHAAAVAVHRPRRRRARVHLRGHGGPPAPGEVERVPMQAGHLARKPNVPHSHRVPRAAAAIGAPREQGSLRREGGAVERSRRHRSHQVRLQRLHTLERELCGADGHAGTCSEHLAAAVVLGTGRQRQRVSFHRDAGDTIHILAPMHARTLAPGSCPTAAGLRSAAPSPPPPAPSVSRPAAAHGARCRPR